MRIGGIIPPAPAPAPDVPEAAPASARYDWSGFYGSVEHKLLSFWDGMRSDMQERTGVDAVQHTYDMNIGFLERKGDTLRAEVNAMPEGPRKEQSREQLENFLRNNTERIENAYQHGMARETASGTALNEQAFQTKVRTRNLL